MKLLQSHLKALLDAIYSIEEMTLDMSPDAAVEDRKTFVAVLGMLVHIWEIVSVLIKNYPEEKITNAKSIIWLRNILAHDYLAIRKSFVRKILEESLPILKNDCTLSLTQQWEKHHAAFVEFFE